MEDDFVVKVSPSQLQLTEAALTAALEKGNVSIEIKDTYQSPTGDYTVYTILVTIEAERWQIMRRYTRFNELFDKLQAKGAERFGEFKFPAKTWFWQSSSDEALVQQRKAQLNEMMQIISKDKELLLAPDTLDFLKPIRSKSQFASVQRRFNLPLKQSSQWIEFVDPFDVALDQFFPVVFFRRDPERDVSEDIERFSSEYFSSLSEEDVADLRATALRLRQLTSLNPLQKSILDNCTFQLQRRNAIVSKKSSSSSVFSSPLSSPSSPPSSSSSSSSE